MRVNFKDLRSKLLQTNDDVEVEFPITAGAMVRGQIKRLLKQLCWSEDVDLNIEEDKGFWGSLLLVTMRGCGYNIATVFDGLDVLNERHSR